MLEDTQRSSLVHSLTHLSVLCSQRLCLLESADQVRLCKAFKPIVHNLCSSAYCNAISLCCDAWIDLSFLSFVTQHAVYHKRSIC